jgi:RNA recognition motif-containing protein
MSTKLYVGNLSFRVTSDDLFEHFSQAGTVESANVVQDRETGRSRGFGFVEMASDDEATNAISEFNGQEYDGRNLVVNEARAAKAAVAEADAADAAEAAVDAAAMAAAEIEAAAADAAAMAATIRVGK